LVVVIPSSHHVFYGLLLGLLFLFVGINPSFQYLVVLPFLVKFINSPLKSIYVLTSKFEHECLHFVIKLKTNNNYTEHMNAAV
jgi:hypothetical protein